jgi:hypothetical protein
MYVITIPLKRMILSCKTNQFRITYNVKQLAMACCVIASAMVVLFSTIQYGWAQTLSSPTESQITVKIDKERYNRGDIMVISGAVKNVVNRIPLTI